MTKRNGLIWMGLIVLAVSWGCQSTADNEPAPAEHLGPVTTEIRLLDADIEGVTVMSGTTPTGQLTAEVKIDNKSQDNKTLEVRVTFLSKKGEAIETTPFAPMVIGAGSIEHYKISSVTTEAETMRVEIRTAGLD